MATVHVEAKRVFVETGEVNKKGKPVKRPVTQRKLFIQGDFCAPTTRQYRVVRLTRKGNVLYSVSYQPLQSKPWWDKTPAQPSDKWVKLQRTNRDGTLDEAVFSQWLGYLLGASAQATKEALDSAVPGE